MSDLAQRQPANEAWKNRSAAVSAAPSTQAHQEDAAGTAAPPFASAFAFPILLLLLLFLLTSLLPARAQTDFARPATSTEFDLNTITTSASVPKVTGEFNLDTRAQTPDLAGGSSSGFFIDTRNLLPTGLAVSGPATISSGGTASYRVLWQPTSGPVVDVTLQSTLGFVGAPPLGTAIGG